MTTGIKLLTSVMLLAFAASALAGVHYVDANSTNATPPYIGWATAATNIQDAVDATVAGDEVVVTNGTYASGGATNSFGQSRVAVDKPLSLRSVNGPAYTVIVGNWGIRCVYLTNDASLAGFTLQHAVLIDKGAGVVCESQSAVVSNCFLFGNGAHFGGGAYGGTLNNCTLGGNFNNNVNPGYGGGAADCTLNNCTLTNNSSVGQYGHGGGAYGCTLNNCTLSGNNGNGAEESELYNCILSGTLSGFGASYCALNNCTVVANQDYGAYQSRLVNCIVYFNNSAGTGGNFGNYDYGGSTLNYCCTTPDPGSIGCITNDPLFVDGDLRLQSNSPCINAGYNVYAPAGPDLNGNPRIAGGTVDIGAYEFQTPTSVISYAWLQQYGLPTDGSADFADPDGDGMNNWREWICDTNPTNALSVLRMLPLSTAASDVNVSWQSVSTRNYVLERSTNLSAQPAFLPLAAIIPGQTGTTTFTDTNAVGVGLYRVGVSAQ